LGSITNSSLAQGTGYLEEQLIHPKCSQKHPYLYHILGWRIIHWKLGRMAWNSLDQVWRRRK